MAPRYPRTKRKGGMVHARNPRSKPRRQGKARGPIKSNRPPDDPRIEAAIRDMNRGRSLTAAARAAHISRPRLRKFLVRRRLVKQRGRRWIPKDNRVRRVPVMTGGRPRELFVRGYRRARLVGEHHNAVGEFVRTNNLEFLTPFKGRSVQAVTGRRYVLETDPNALHRIAAMDSPPFHEIYEIISNT